MSNCKHPKEFVSNLGGFKVCNLCGERLPLDYKPKKEEKKEEPKEAKEKHEEK